MKVPYIGITDFTSAEQARNMLTVFAANQNGSSKRKLMVGVMMSYRTLHGLPTEWMNVFPQKETIVEIFCSDDAYNCLHYADYGEDPRLWKSLSDAISYGGIGIHALQLDMVWP